MAGQQRRQSQALPPLYHSTSSSNSPSIPSTASPRSPSGVPPNMSVLSGGLMTRGDSGPFASYPNLSTASSGPTPMPGVYSQSYEQIPVTPGHGPHGYLDHPRSERPGTGTPSMAHAHISTAALQAQKRAYRQRRKDPSCDACRERKVKCDATDTSSCSECMSRNVRCQFTKETNRRMSSMKQVQDLEKQLAQTRQEANHLRSLLKSGGPMDVETSLTSDLQLPQLDLGSRRQQQAPPTREFSNVQRNIRIHGQGIIKAPSARPPTMLLQGHVKPLPDLPPRQLADTLLRQYHSSLHNALPILHWRSFSQQYERVYQDGSLQSVSRVWAALFFVVLACGTIRDTGEDGRSFLQVSQELVDPWTEDVTMEHAQFALLSSIYLVETNNRSAGWTSLGYAVRVAQDVGLHKERGSWTVEDGEMRRRVWWSIYISERILALELDRPPMIDDEDCDVSPPDISDDTAINTSTTWLPPSLPRPSPTFAAVVRVVKCISQLLKTLRQPDIPSPAIYAIDEQLSNCFAGFPPLHHIQSNEYLDPRTFHPMVYLQNARLALHRHNLSPMCTSETRSVAVDNCILAARDTAKIISRTMQDPPDSPAQGPEGSQIWLSNLRSAASASLCTHLWRCILFLCFRGEYQAALVCAQASSSIDDARPVNMICGRHLSFFLRQLLTKLQQGEGAYLERDEEMIAYVSGDLQGGDRSWVWNGGSRGSPRNMMDHASSTGRTAIVTSPEREESGDWAGWVSIVAALRRLINEQQRSHSQHHGPVLPRPPPGDTSQADSILPRILSPGGSNRISIANII